MATMDFFRRPVLVGKTLSRQVNGTVRGDLRRSDIDGFSAEPYFPGITGGEELEVSIDGAAPVTATITGPGMATVLADINTALAGDAIAFDADGTIGIRTIVAGTPGSIEVTGGDAADALGFYLTKNKYKSVGGEIPSTPEARRGNPFGTGFLTRGENFTAESVQRGLSRLASNVDVLYSEAARNDVVVRSVAFSTADNTRLELTIDTDELFTGLNLWTNTTQKEDLAPYFFLIDTITKQPAKSRVVAVVRGAPGGSPPFADATAWSGVGEDGNILGVSLEKVSAEAITTITGGRVVECAGADFSETQPGDFATIIGATNVSPFSNNGERWVVEEVLSTTTVALRPMSKSELALVGLTPTDAQPVIELNDQKTGLEVFGTLTIKTGTWSSGQGAGISVVVSPPMPTGASYQLFVAQPISNRVKRVYDNQSSAGAPFREFVSDLDPVANWTLSGLVASLGGGNCNVTAGNILWHGRVYNLPAATFLPADFGDGTNYLYWLEATSNYAISTTTTVPWAGVLDPADANKGHLVAVVVKGAGVLSSVLPATRLRGEKAISVTVGSGGQFSNLFDACTWARHLQSNYAESTASGTYPHFEFLLVSDSSTNNQSPFLPNPGCIVRGINPSIKLDLGTGSLQVASGQSELRDFQVSATGAMFANMVSGTERLRITNVKHIATPGSSLTEIVSSSLGGSIQHVVITNSFFTVKKGVTDVLNGASSLICKGCTFTYDNTGAVVPHIVQSFTTGVNWDGDLLVFENCDFLGSWGATTADLDPIFVSATTSTSKMILKDIRFSLGVFSSANANVFINASGNAQLTVDDFIMTSGQISKVIAGSSPFTNVTNSTFRSDPATGHTALTGRTFSNCNLSHQDTTASGSGFGIEVVLGGLITGCSVSGPFNTSIRVDVEDVIVSNNRVDIFKLTNGFPSVGIGVTGNGDGTIVEGNVVVWPFASGSAVGAGGSGISATGSRVSVIGNRVYIPAPSASNNIWVGIANSNGPGSITNGNYVTTVGTGVAAASQSVTGLSVGGPGHTAVGNLVILTGTTTQDFRGVQYIQNSTGGIFADNRIESYGRTFVSGSTCEDAVISGNDFVSTTSNAITGGHVQQLGGFVTGNRFSSAGGTNPVPVGFGNYSNNRFVGNVVLENGIGGSGLTNFVFSNNYVDGNFDGASAGAVWSHLELLNNRITGDLSVDFSFVVGTPPDIICSGNIVDGDLDLTGNVAYEAVVVGNEADSFSVSIQTGVPASRIIFNSNLSYTGDAIVSGGIVECQSNIIATDLTIDDGNAPGASTRATVIGNSVSGDLDASSHELYISNNTFNGSCLIARPTGLGVIAGVLDFTFNHVGGDFQADSIDTGVYLFRTTVIHGNFFDATTISTWSAKAEEIHVSENRIVPTNGVQVTVGGAQTYFDSNQVYASAFSAGANQTTRVTLTHTSALGSFWARGNFVYGRMDVDTGVSLAHFETNNVHSLWNTASCLTVSGAVTNSISFVNNHLVSDVAGTATDFSGFNIFVNGSCANVFVQGNRLRITGTSATYTTGAILANVVLQNIGGTADRVLLEGNIIDKPAGGTITGQSVVTEQFRANNLSNFFAVGNLMFTNNALGLTVGRGDPLLNVGPTDPFTLGV